jgi:hypothetical protein
LLLLHFALSPELIMGVRWFELASNDTVVLEDILDFTCFLPPILLGGVLLSSVEDDIGNSRGQARPCGYQIVATATIGGKDFLERR